MRLIDALRCGDLSRVAFTGAGGKTTAMFQLARELPGPALVSASTHLGAWQAALADEHWALTRPEELGHQLDADIKGAGVYLFTGPLEQENARLRGLPPDVLDRLHHLAGERSWPLLVEADGSRQKPLKAPADHEPVIPAWIKTVVVCAGLSGLGRALSDEHIHRAELFGKLAGVEMGTAVTPEMVAAVLRHPQGGLKGIPADAKKVALLNQADTAALRSSAAKMAAPLLAQYDAVAVAALQAGEVFQTFEPVAGVILAAGGARRFGEPKALLTWRGQSFVRRVAETALSAGLEPVRVVVGAEEEAVRADLEGLPVEIVANALWEAGQSTSLRAGLGGLSRRSGAVVFLLADQPQVQAGLVRALVDLHASTLSPITAPRVRGRRANPVLFDRVTFAELKALQGDTGGRPLFEKYRPAWLDSADESLLLDVDTPADYAALLSQDPADE